MTTPLCRCHGCRFEKPGLERRVGELSEELALLREHESTQRINARQMFNALDYIQRQCSDPKAMEIAADCLHSLLTDVAA